MEIWIPESAREHAEPKRVFRCQVATGHTEESICGREFPVEQALQYRRHVVACAKRNEGSIAELAHKRASNPFTGILDQERHDWIRERERTGQDVDYIKDGLAV